MVLAFGVSQFQVHAEELGRGLCTWISEVLGQAFEPTTFLLWLQDTAGLIGKDTYMSVEMEETFSIHNISYFNANMKRCDLL